MVSIYQLAGYKFYGDRPESSIGRSLGTFRDNLTYISASFSDWKEDRKKLMFIFDEHVGYLDIKIFDKLFASHLIDNVIPQIHIVLKEHTDETNGNLALMVTTTEPEGVMALIVKKKKFYHVELPLKKKLEWEALTRPKAKRAARKKPGNPTSEAAT
jgi:hypothetical protein